MTLPEAHASERNLAPLRGADHQFVRFVSDSAFRPCVTFHFTSKPNSEINRPLWSPGAPPSRPGGLAPFGPATIHPFPPPLTTHAASMSAARRTLSIFNRRLRICMACFAEAVGAFFGHGKSDGYRPPFSKKPRSLLQSSFEPPSYLSIHAALHLRRETKLICGIRKFKMALVEQVLAHHTQFDGLGWPHSDNDNSPTHV